MGGYSSGRYRTRNRGAVEAALRVDMRYLRRIGYLVPEASSSGMLRWSCNDQPSGSIGITVDLRDEEDLHATLDYSVNGDPRHQRITVEAKPCRYGGRRFYFRCPKTGDRCEVLAFAVGSFASRRAQRLTHHSQSEDRLGRLHRARLKVEARILGAKGMPRPRGANRRRLVDRWAALEQATDDLFASTAMRRFGMAW
jgi:hypothetical protein